MCNDLQIKKKEPANFCVLIGSSTAGMAARYLKWWRKINAQVNALAQSSSSSDNLEQQEEFENIGTHTSFVEESSSLHTEESFEDSSASDHRVVSSSDSE